MTPSERERRIEAGLARLRQGLLLGGFGRDRDEVEAILDAADEAVPMVSTEIVSEMVWLRREDQKRELEQRAERAEAAARDFAKALEEIGQGRSHPREPTDGEVARAALKRHPSFSGEEGTEE